VSLLSALVLGGLDVERNKDYAPPSHQKTRRGLSGTRATLL
jgi:hypothetical protein